MKNMKKTLPAFVMACFLTSGCAQMPKNMDWLPKWDAGSAESKAENENLDPDSKEKPKKKLSYWKQIEGWVQAGIKKPDQESTPQPQPTDPKPPVEQKIQEVSKAPVKKPIQPPPVEKKTG